MSRISIIPHGDSRGFETVLISFSCGGGVSDEKIGIKFSFGRVLGRGVQGEFQRAVIGEVDPCAAV